MTSKIWTVEGIAQSTTRQVTHAVASTSHRGERVIVLTRSPKSALAEAKRFGDTAIVLYVLDTETGEAKESK